MPGALAHALSAASIMDQTIAPAVDGLPPSEHRQHRRQAHFHAAAILDHRALEHDVATDGINVAQRALEPRALEQGGAASGAVAHRHGLDAFFHGMDH